MQTARPHTRWFVAALILAAGVPAAPALAQFESGGTTCETYIRITEYPAVPQLNTATANFRVRFGEVSDLMAEAGEPITCLSDASGPGMQPATFRFYVNGVDRTSYFTTTWGEAVGTNVPLVDESDNTFAATIAGYDANLVPRTDADTKDGPYVDMTPLPSISAAFYNYDSQQAALCAVSCFAATYTKSTVPYFSGDTQRSVTLVYHGDRVGVRPFVYVDVAQPAGSPVPIKSSLEARVNGAARQFLNGSAPGYLGETEIFFAGSADSVRLAGQIDVSDLATGVYPLQLVVRTYYSSKVESQTISTSLVVVNEQRSLVARGWTVAGVQRIYVQANGDVLLTEGDGSALLFRKCGTGCYQTPDGDFSVLRVNASNEYVRSYPDSTKATFSAAGLHRMTADRFNNYVQFDYDGSGRLIRVVDPYRKEICASPCVPAAAYVTLSYGSYGLQQVVEPGGERTTTFSVGSDSTLQAITDPDGLSTVFGYDAKRRLGTITDRRGALTTLHYDERSWKLSSVEAPAIALDPQLGGGTTRLTTQYEPWQTRGVPTTTTAGSPPAAVRPDSMYARVVEPGNVATKFTTNRWGQARRVTDPLGNVTLIEYSGVLPATINEPTGWTDFWYSGPFATRYYRNGVLKVNARYAAYGQVDSLWGAGVTSERRFIGANGVVDSVRYASSSTRVARYTYDARGRVTQISDLKKHVTKYHYDAMFGNLDSTLAPGDRFTRAQFDGFGRVFRSQVRGLAWKQMSYDLLNRVRSLSDGVNSTPTVTAYDALYPTSVTDPKGQVYGFTFNDLGLQTTRTDPSGRKDSTYYNERGLTSTAVNRRGQHVRFTYDPLGRLLSKQGENTTADSLGYSASGLVTAAWNAIARDSIFRGLDGWIDSAVTRIQGRQFRRVYERNANFGTLNRLRVTTPGGAIIFYDRQYNWDTQTGRLNSIGLGGSGTTTFARDAEGARTTTLWPNGLQRTDSSTAIHSVFQQGYARPSTPSTLPAAAVPLWRGYGFDTTGRASHERQMRGTGFGGFYSDAQYFNYDALGRLTHVDSVVNEFYATEIPGLGYFEPLPHDSLAGFGGYHDPWGASEIQYTYDAVGNRTDHGATAYDLGNRITSFAGMSFLHDNDGNVSQKTDASGTTQYSWTSDGRLATVIRGGTRLDYQYDALGRLVRRDRNGTPERVLLWDNDQLLAELDGTGTQRIADYAYYPGVDRPLAISTGATGPHARFFAQTPLGNVEGVVSDVLGLDQDVRYDPFGRPVTIGGALADTNRLRWKGAIWEGDVTQLYYMRNRWYDPVTGRFVSEDPIGFPGDENMYIYTGDDPVNYTDPYGLCKTVYYTRDGVPDGPGPDAPNGDQRKDILGDTYTCSCDGLVWVAGTDGDCPLKRQEDGSLAPRDATATMGVARTKSAPLPVVTAPTIVSRVPPDLGFDCTTEEAVVETAKKAGIGLGAFALGRAYSASRAPGSRSGTVQRVARPGQHTGKVAGGIVAGAAVVQVGACVAKSLSPDN